MGTIASSIRAFVAERDTAPTGGSMGTAAVASELGFRQADFDGTYFDSGNFSYTCTYDATGTPPLTFTITGSNTDLTPGSYTLDEDGVWDW